MTFKQLDGSRSAREMADFSPLGRRVYLGAMGTAAVGTLAGCLNLITGDGPIEVSASPARPSEQVRAETGYEQSRQEEQVIERTFEAADQRRQVVVTNWETECQKALDLAVLGEQETAVFIVLTTPQVSVLNRAFNPVAEMSTREIAEMVQEEYDDMGDLNHRGDRSVTIDGATTTESVFAAEAVFAGQTMDIHLHLTEAVELGEDLVLAIGAYPALSAAEGDNIHRLIEGIEPDD